MKILIVDDDPKGLYMLEAMFKGAGYEVMAAKNGQIALELARTQLPEIIISDILMPVMDGFQLCRQVKGDEELKDIPFVFYTATYTDEKDEELALQMGADKFIRKPVEPDEFIKIVQGVIKDVDKNKLGRKQPVLVEEKEVFKLYSECLIRKLEKKMLDLESESAKRRLTEETLRKAHDELEMRVEERTNELSNANRQLQQEIEERKQAEEKQKKLQAQLAQAQKMEAIGTLAGGIAHNFNNLLMGVMGNTSLMLLETDPDHPNYEKLKIIEKQVQNGSKLTYQLLGYAREGGYEVKPLSLNQLIKETSETFAMTKKEIMVHRELAEDLLGAKADQDQIEQVLLNLYVNAADAMSGGGDLFLKTTNVTREDMRGKPYEAKPGDYVLLTVRDTGIGMDKKTMEKIFDPFFTTKEMARGSGLGLASVYGIIKAHGGYIDVESKKGHGTTFTIYLPASSEKIAIKEKGLPKKILKGKETILLVDDEDIIIDVGEEMLKTLGYKVLIARGGKEAIKLYRKNKDKIDMVLLDMVMPEMGGGETYDRMKGINPDIKVLLSSGYSIDGQATEILKRGSDGFIQKPFDVHELSQRIRKILDKK